MPIYTFKCACGEVFDVIRSIKEDNGVATCQKCGRVTKTRIYTPVSVHFSGPGFYCTDHKKGDQNGK